MARNADEDPDEAIAPDPANRRRAILTAVAAGIFFVVALMVGKDVADDIGHAPMLWLGRLICFTTLLAILIARRDRLWDAYPLAMVAMVVMQGVSEALAYPLFFMAGQGEGSAIASVAASGFMVVLVLLGWTKWRPRSTISNGISTRWIMRMPMASSNSISSMPMP